MSESTAPIALEEAGTPGSREHAISVYRSVIAQACELGAESVRRVKRELAKRDLFFLLSYVLGRPDVNKNWIFERCREVESAPDGYLDLWAREHYKSTLITFGLTIQEVLRDPEVTVGIFSYSRPIGKAFLRQIKREFEANEMLRGLFPDIFWEKPDRDAPKWSEDDGIVVRRTSNPKESTIEAWGLVDGQPTSKHFKLMVYDDVVTKDSVTTPDMIRKVTEAWEVSRNLTSEGGRTRYIGTRWHVADTYREILARGAAKERRHAVTEDGTEDGNPVLWTRERVIEKRREMGPYVFGSQMLLDPTADRTQGFRDEWLRFYEKDSDFDGLNKYLLVDAASEKKKSSDYTAMVVIGLSSNYDVYLLDAIRDRLSLRERGDAVFSLHRRWRVKGIGYEKYGMMADVEYLKERMARENYYFDIAELGGQVAKTDSIRRMVPIFEAGRFRLPRMLHKTDYEGRVVDLVQSFVDEEYKPFPVGLHDDMLDAISRIQDPEMFLTWPHEAAQRKVIDRYALPRHRNRAHLSQWVY
jgi:phage terminase large subunit-like protein